jgi:hypothetical protein
MIASLFAAAMLLAPPLEEWRLISVAGNNAAGFLVDIDSIQRPPGGNPTARVLLVVADGLEDWAAIEARFEFDCSGRRKRGISAVTYDAAGKLIDTETSSEDWQAVKPGSNDSHVTDFVCGDTSSRNTPSFGKGLPIGPVRAYLAAEAG